MSEPSAPKKTTVSNFQGFLQADINKFLKEGQSISTTNLNVPSNIPVQQTIRRETRRQSGKGFLGRTGGFTEGVTTSEQLVSESAVANISQSQLDAFVNAFTNRVSNIRGRLAKPGRERLFIRE